MVAIMKKDLPRFFLSFFAEQGTARCMKNKAKARD
jgi:hypothetical protein